MSPRELVQLLNDVLGELDPRQRVDLASEAPESAAQRIVTFLGVLMYQIPHADLYVGCARSSPQRRVQVCVA